MARIRTIKPEFPQSESMGQCTRDARLTFLLLFTMADDAGRLRANSRMLASLLFPYDDDAKKHIESWLSELAKVGCIQRYQVGGDSYLSINKWGDHQKIDKPTPSKLPEPPESSREVANPRESSSMVAEVPSADRNGMEGIGKEWKGSGCATPDGVSDSVWQDFKKLRAAKKSPITETAMDGIRREAAAAGYSFEKALSTCCERGWTGFKADWVAAKDFKGQPVAQALVSDPESRASIEAEGVAKGIGAWDEGSEQWHIYKAKVRGSQRSLSLTQLTNMAQRRVAA